MCKEYNGYTNYQTWCVSLWIDNDEYNYEFIKTLTETLMSYGRDSTHYDLSRSIQTWVNDNAPLINESSMYSDLLGHALSSVDWYEIADNWIENVKENE